MALKILQVQFQFIPVRLNKIGKSPQDGDLNAPVPVLAYDTGESGFGKVPDI